VTTKATLYGAGNADLGLCSIGQRLLIRNDLEGVDHIPVAALGIVSVLSDPVPGRQALDTPCRLANFESPLEKLTDGASCGQGKRTNGTVAGRSRIEGSAGGPARNASGDTLSLPS
jgi:hypothetical protein